MVKELREQFNQNFTEEKYGAFLNDIFSVHGPLQFRVAETPVFVPKEFLSQLISACESIVDVILQPDFKELTQKAIPENMQVKNENDFPQFITFDFGVCKNDQDALEPQLIEMQAFPTLFGYEVLLDSIYFKHFWAPANYSSYLNNHNKDSYLQLFKEILLNGHAAENVVLLEIFPEKQKTSVDFYCTQDYTGVGPLCVTKLIKRGRQLYYMRDDE